VAANWGVEIAHGLVGRSNVRAQDLLERLVHLAAPDDPHDGNLQPSSNLPRSAERTRPPLSWACVRSLRTPDYRSMMKIGFATVSRAVALPSQMSFVNENFAVFGPSGEDIEDARTVSRKRPDEARNTVEGCAMDRPRRR